MKRDFYKGLLCGAVIVGLFSTPLISNAGSILKSITVAQGGIDIYVDGKLIQPLDGNGKPVQPFVYDGTTYLPLRALSNALTGGTKEVKWDAQNKRVYVGQAPINGQVDLGKLEAYSSNLINYNLENNEYYQILDKKYYMTNALVQSVNRKSLGPKSMNETNYHFDYRAYNDYITDSKYSKIKGKLITNLSNPGSKTSTKLFIVSVTAQGERTLLGQYEHKAGMPAVDIDCDISGVNILRIYEYTDDVGYFYDATLEGVK